MRKLPQGWAYARLDQVTSPRGEKADPSTLGDLPFIGMDHIEAHTAKLLGSQPVSELKSAVAVFKAGDLLYGRLRPYLNKVHLAGFDGAASAEFIVFPSSKSIEQRYLQCILRSREYRAIADQRSTGDRPRVKFEDVGDYEIPLPPLPEQRRIVHKLETLSARTTRARMHLCAIQTFVERYKQAALTSLTIAPEAENPDWKLVTLEQVRDPKASIRYGVVQPGTIKDQGVPLIRVCDLIGGRVHWNELRRVSPEVDEAYAKARIQDGDVLVSVVGTIGRVALVEGVTERTNIARAVSRIRPNRSLVDPAWLFWRLSAADAQARFDGDVREVARKTLNITLIKETPFRLPPLEDQRAIVRRIEAAFGKIDGLAAEAERALKLTDRLDQRLLVKAFDGELVPQDPNDEPAEVLLERIRTESGLKPKVRRGRKTSAVMHGSN